MNIFFGVQKVLKGPGRTNYESMICQNACTQLQKHSAYCGSTHPNIREHNFTQSWICTASTQFTAFLLDYFLKTFLRKTLTPHCGPTLTTLPKDVFIFQQSLQLSFKINVGEKCLKYFKIASSLWPHHIPGVNDLNKPQSYLQTSNNIHMYIFICKIATPNCGPFNSTIGDHDLNNFKFAQPKDAFTQVHKLMLLKPICFWKKHFKLLFVYYKIWHPHPHPPHLFT